MKKFDDGYPDLGFSYNNNGHGRTDGWKWTAIISLSMSVLLAVSFVLYVVLRGSTPVDTVPQGEYWRTHDNTRLGDDDIDEWINNLLGSDNIANDDIQFEMTDEKAIEIVSGLLTKTENLDSDMWIHFNDDNSLDFVQYSFEPLTSRDEKIKDIVNRSFELDETVQPKLYTNSDFIIDNNDEFYYGEDWDAKNASLNSMLIANGLTYAAAAVIIGCLATVKVSTVGMWVFPPITMPIAAAAIAVALGVMVITILANWDVMSGIIDAVKRFFTDVVGPLRGIVDGFFSRTSSKAKAKTEVRYESTVYVKTSLERVAQQIKRDNKTKIYIILGIESGKIVLGIIAGKILKTGGISEDTAVSIMKNRPNQYLYTNGLNPNKDKNKNMVVSIYTYNHSKADSISKKASGNNTIPVFHKADSGYKFDHYHNGKTFAQYTSKDESLPHAFCGIMGGGY